MIGIRLIRLDSGWMSSPKISIMGVLFSGLVILSQLVDATGPPYNSSLLHPRNGDTVDAGKKFLVTWTVDNSISNLDLVMRGAGFNFAIAREIANTGSWEWNVEEFWPSTTSVYMVLDRVDWNTNTDISMFTMVCVVDQNPSVPAPGPLSIMSAVTTITQGGLTTITQYVTGAPTATVSTTSSYTASPRSHTLSAGAVGGIVGGSLVALLILVAAIYYSFCFPRRRGERAREESYEIPQSQPYYEPKEPPN